MDFDIVIATRNRQAALGVSLPLMLGQTRLPAKLVIVDASDDHDGVKRTVERGVETSGAWTSLEIARSTPGSALQRNVGLGKVVSPVVFFPDDDALWFPLYAEAIMEIYERDRDGVIGGVGGIESPFPPPGVLDGIGGTPYRMEARDRLQQLFGRFLDKVEHTLFPDPIFIEGDERGAKMMLPAWLDGLARPVSAFPGFLMSFRTDLIKKKGFDRTLGTYALFEDYDASLAILERHLLIEAKRAKVFHFRAPQKRVNGREWGVVQILNRTYVVCKNSPPGSPARRRLLAYSCYKLLRYAVQAQSHYGRERVRGAARALSLMGQLYALAPADLPAAYERLRMRCLPRP